MTSSIPPAIPPDASRDESSRRELQARLAGLGDLRGKRLTAEQKGKKLREACEGFESVFIQKMWQEMRKTVPQGALLHSREEKFWQDMYDQELAKKMTSAGGIGLADMMYQQLSQNLVSATRSVTGMTQGAAFRPSAAPLLPQDDMRREATPAARRDDTPQTLLTAAAPRMNALPSVYEGPAPQHDVVKEAGAKAGQKSADEPDILTVRADTPAEADPPEVSEALARLRLHQAAPENRRIDAMPAGQGARRHYPESGLDLARTAQREAGTKLGPAAVRPPLHPAAKNQDRRTITQAGIPMDGPAAVNAPQEETQAAGNPGRKVRYTTNSPSGGQRERGRINDEMLRAMQAQNPAPSPPPLMSSPKAEPARGGTTAATADTASDTRDSRAVPPLTAS
ncbi:MAG: rod-binding protein [Desulfovibrio sp.]|jgi:Rod binding domain-containing protein|nr:rod-binding protein [Desulfovibrio sp.]